MNFAAPQLFPAYYAIVLAIFVGDQWRRFRLARPDRNITYRITEIWAAIAGLTPSFAFFAFAVKRNDDGVFMAICFAMSQIAGILALKLSHEIEPEANEPVISIFLGAVLGMFLSVVVPVALILIAIAIIFFPVTIVFALGGIIYWASHRSSARGVDRP